MITEELTKGLAIMNGVPPQTLNNTNASGTSGVDMSKSKRCLHTVYIGAVTGGGAITIQAIESVNSDLSSPSNVAGATNTLSGLNTTNKIYTIEIRADQVAKRYQGVKITETGSQNVLVAGLSVGYEGDFKPNNAFNGTQVATQNIN